MAESKLRENTRYLGYTAGIVGGMILMGLVWLFIGPILAFIWSFIWIFIVLAAIFSIAAVAIYFVFFRERQ